VRVVRGPRRLGHAGEYRTGSAEGDRRIIIDATGANTRVLYLNGNKMGELTGLKSILAVDIYEVKYLDPSRAEDQFGIGHSGGAVLVQLIKGLKSDARPNP